MKNKIYFLLLLAVHKIILSMDHSIVPELPQVAYREILENLCTIEFETEEKLFEAFNNFRLVNRSFKNLMDELIIEKHNKDPELEKITKLLPNSYKLFKLNMISKIISNNIKKQLEKIINLPSAININQIMLEEALKLKAYKWSRFQVKHYNICYFIELNNSIFSNIVKLDNIADNTVESVFVDSNSDLNLIEERLKLGANPNIPSHQHDDSTAMFDAIECSNSSKFKLFLKYGGRLNLFNIKHNMDLLSYVIFIIAEQDYSFTENKKANNLLIIVKLFLENSASNTNEDKIKALNFAIKKKDENHQFLIKHSSSALCSEREIPSELEEKKLIREVMIATNKIKNLTEIIKVLNLI